MADSLKSRRPIPTFFQIVGTVALMVVSSAAAGAGMLVVLMSLGLKLHSNYEHYGQLPTVWLIPIAAVVGFAVPGILVWKLREHQWRVSLRTLLITMTLIAVVLGAVIWAMR